MQTSVLACLYLPHTQKKLNGEVINGRLFNRWDSHREIHGVQEGIRVIVPPGGSVIRCDEDFIVGV